MTLLRCVTLACLMTIVQATPSVAAERVFLGYYSAIGGLPVHKVPFGQLTHVSHAFLALDAEGKAAQVEGVPSQELVAAAHRQRVQVLLSVGGGKTTEGLNKLSQQPQALQSLAAKVVKIAVDNGYDGVDLVWESPSDEQTRAGFVTLVSAMRRLLDSTQQSKRRESRYLLTVGAPPSGHLGKWIDTGAVLNQVDWLNLSAYDMSGPWQRTAGHHAPLLPSTHDPEKGWRSVDAAVNYWIKERGVPAEKLVLGLAMYGRALPVSKVHEPLDPAKREQHGALPFNRVRGLVDQKWRAMWDKESKTPWLSPPEQGDQPLLICYDDRNSIHYKAVWARERELRGLYFWAIHQDRMPDGTHWLLSAAEKAWPKSE